MVCRAYPHNEHHKLAMAGTYVAMVASISSILGLILYSKNVVGR